MFRNLKKILIPAVLATLVLAVSAGAASAALFHSAAEPTTITATQSASHIYKFGEYQITCKVLALEGTQAIKTTESLTMKFGYPENCDMVIGGTLITVDAKENGCHWLLQASGSEKIECPAGQVVEFSISGCLWKVPPQTVKGVAYDNNGSQIDITWALTGISYSYTGFICGSGSAVNGTYQGTATAKGNAGLVKIWWE